MLCTLVARCYQFHKRMKLDSHLLFCNFLVIRIYLLCQNYFMDLLYTFFFIPFCLQALIFSNYWLLKCTEAYIMTLFSQVKLCSREKDWVLNLWQTLLRYANIFTLTSWSKHRNVSELRSSSKNLEVSKFFSLRLFPIFSALSLPFFGILTGFSLSWG